MNKRMETALVVAGPKINNKKLGTKLKLTHTLANLSKEILGNL